VTRALLAVMLTAVLTITPAHGAGHRHPLTHAESHPARGQSYTAPATYTLPTPTRDAFRVTDH
jgi:hypothetical protein